MSDLPEDRERAKDGPVRSVTRALQILAAFAAPPHCMGITELSERVHLAKGTVHLLVQTLVSAGYLVQCTGSRKYRPGGVMYDLLAALPVREDVQAMARTEMERLCAEVSLPVYLTTMVGSHVVLVDKVEPPMPFLLVLQVGTQMPMHCSALAKLLLAFLPAVRREALLASLEAVGLFPATPNTITDPALLRQDLAETAVRGYALDREETVPGLFSLAVPVRNSAGDVVAALGVGALTNVLNAENYAAILPALQRYSGLISARLGYHDGEQ